MVKNAPAQDSVLIERLQKEAAESPRAYRARLTLLAVGGDLALTATYVAPWAVMLFFGAVLMNMKLFYWLSAAGVVLLVWLMRPTLRFKGRELRREEAPQLFEAIAALRAKLQVPGKMRVYLDDSFNAGAAETRGLFGVAGTQCILVLGVPLLAALSREQVLAVVAHELGHFSRRHGRLGQWLYRAREGWIDYMSQVQESDSSFDRAAAWYARAFVPYFSARSFVHSRQCEYEADADAAFATSGTVFAQALTRTAVIGRVWAKRMPRELAAWKMQSAEPPADFHRRFAAVASGLGSAEAQAWVDEALREPSSWQDTHPSLSERLESLGQEPALSTVEECAGAALFGDGWNAIVGEFDARWTREAKPDWLIEHLRLKHITHALISADAASAKGWDAERRLTRARALRALDPAAGLAELRELYERYPAHGAIRFAYAAALLNEDDPAGVAILEKLARESAAVRVAAFTRVAAYYERIGDSAQTERWSSFLKRALEKQRETVRAFWERTDSGRAAAAILAAAPRAALAEAVRLDPCIERAWLLGGEGVHALVLCIDFERSSKEQQDEEAIAARYEWALQSLIGHDEIALVRTYYATEGVPAAYSARQDLSLEPADDTRTARA